jgi:NAD-specific glutamate dehydrogenase
VARAHFGLSARLGLDWLQAKIDALPATGSWSSAARSRLQSASLAGHRRLTAAALLPINPRRSAPARAGATPNALERWQQVLRDVRALTSVDLAALSVAVEALEALAAHPAPLRLT